MKITKQLLKQLVEEIIQEAAVPLDDEEEAPEGDILRTKLFQDIIELHSAWDDNPDQTPEQKQYNSELGALVSKYTDLGSKEN